MTVKIFKLNHEGRGVAHIDGKILFLEGGLPGEEVEFISHRNKQRFSEGEITQILTTSPYRINPRCPFQLCGGCSLQHVASDFQIQHKQSVLLEHLAHIGKVKPLELLPPITGPLFGYRRKARLGVRFVEKKQKLLIGFREKKGRFLVEMDHCAVLDARVGLKLQEINALLMSLTSFKQIPQIEVAAGDNKVALVFRHLVPLTSEDQQKLSDFGEANHFQIYTQGHSNFIDRLYPKTHEFLFYCLPEYGLEIFFHPLDFIQINGIINQKMIQQAIKLLSPQPHDRILDLFCGLGNFSLPLARYGSEVDGVEGSEQMVKQGEYNAFHNGVHSVHFYAANLEADFMEEVWGQKNYNKILLDPPRIGAFNIIKQIHRFKAKMILYVSCHSATLARDAGLLSQQGYVLTKAGIIDMFPHTQHVECMALFEKF